jgi:phosphatidylglycerol:prolipoprotein diacylglycerol transferase
MDPVAISLGTLEIRWYGIMMALSMMLGAWIGARLLTKNGRNGELVWDGLVWLILAGVFGARLVYILTNLGAYAADPSEIFKIWHGGLSFHGGIIAGGIATYYYFRSKGIPFLEVMDAFAPGVSVGIILVRIGNFMNGDILGYRWDGPWAMNFPWDELHSPPGQDPTVILRHPAELYGLLVGVICTLICFWLWRTTYVQKRTLIGTTFCAFIISYSLVRSVIEEPFRDVPLLPAGNPLVDPATAGYGLVTTTQAASVVLIIIAVVLMTQLRRWQTAGVMTDGVTRQQRRALQRERSKRD